MVCGMTSQAYGGDLHGIELHHRKALLFSILFKSFHQGGSLNLVLGKSLMLSSLLVILPNRNRADLELSISIR